MKLKMKMFATMIVVLVMFQSLSMMLLASEEAVLGPVTEIVTVEGVDDVDIVQEVITGEEVSGELVVIEDEMAPLAATVAASSTGVPILLVGIVALASVIALALVVGCVIGRRSAEW